MKPHLQPIIDEVPTTTSANFQDGARLDVAADGFCGSHFEWASFDVKVFNLTRRPQLSVCYRSHEASKKRAYERRTLEVEHLLHPTYHTCHLEAKEGRPQLHTSTSLPCCLSWPGFVAIFPFTSCNPQSCASEEHNQLSYRLPVLSLT